MCRAAFRALSTGRGSVSSVMIISMSDPVDRCGRGGGPEVDLMGSGVSGQGINDLPCLVDGITHTPQEIGYS